jgi:hypothetical protein
MEQALLIAVIVLLIVVCLLAVLAIVLLVKSRKPAGTNPLADPTYQALEKEIRDQGQANTTLLLNFQKMVNDSLTNNASLSNHSLTESIAALTTKVDDNLKDINEKVSQSLVSGFKGTSDTMGEIKERLGHIDETQKSLASLREPGRLPEYGPFRKPEPGRLWRNGAFDAALQSLPRRQRNPL